MKQKQKLNLIRKIRFWVRVVPRRGVGKPAEVYHRIYRTKKAATAACKRGEMAVDVVGFYPTPLGKSAEQK